MNAKFKVWDNIAKKMHIENTGFHLFSNGALGYNCGDVYDIVDKSNFEIIFYTGLKDKAGKEIYELHEINHKFRVVYKFNRYILQDISNSDIFEEILQNGEYEITGEYSPLEKN